MRTLAAVVDTVAQAFGAAGAALGLYVVFWALALLIALGVPLALKQQKQQQQN